MSNSKVLDRVIYECREAYLSKQPLIFIKTEEKEFVFSVIKESNLVSPGTQNSYSGFPTGFYNFLKDASREKWFDFIQTESSKLKIESNIPFAFMICLPDENLRIIKDKYRHEALSEYVWRYINETNSQSSLSKNLVILYGDPAFLPSDLIPYTAVIEVGFPEKQEIKEIIKEDYKCCTGRDPDEDLVYTYADEMSGLGIMDVHRRMNLLLGNTASDHRTLFETKNESKKALRRAKEIVLKLNGNILTLMEKDEEAELGGLEQYSKYWTSDNGGNLNHLKDPDRYLLERGVPPLKGVLLCGIPGCGKSAAVKILQRDSGLPVLRMSIDQLMGQYVGNSEENMRIALSQAEAMAPCILFVDEIEKGFKGAGGSDKGSDTFMRMFGRFLTWMQDRKKPVFIFATANDISSLPPEFFRSGRFDESFGLFMPTEKECKSIFKAQMKIREKKWCKARSVDNNEVKLFDGECFDDKCLADTYSCDIVNETLKKSDQLFEIPYLDENMSLAMQSVVAYTTMKSGMASFDSSGIGIGETTLAICLSSHLYKLRHLFHMGEILDEYLKLHIRNIWKTVITWLSAAVIERYLIFSSFTPALLISAACSLAFAVIYSPAIVGCFGVLTENIDEKETLAMATVKPKLPEIRGFVNNNSNMTIHKGDHARGSDQDEIYDKEGDEESQREKQLQ